MTVGQLRQSAQQTLKGLPAAQLKVASEFLRYLDERASQEATEELLRIPGILESLERAEQDVAEGRTTPVEKLKRKYKRVAKRGAQQDA